MPLGTLLRCVTFCVKPRPAVTRRYPVLTPQTGIGAEVDIQAALKWYKQAAEGGDKRAIKRLASSGRGSNALDRRLEMEAMKEEHVAKGGKGDNCVVM